MQHHLFSIAIAAASCAAASSAQTEEPQAEPLLAKTRQAVHGDAAPMTRMSCQGTCSLSWHMRPIGKGGTFSAWFDGDRSYQRRRIDPAGTFETGSDGTLAWEIDPVTGAAVMDAECAGTNRRVRALWTQRPWREVYASARTVDARQIGKRRVWCVELKTADGVTDRLFIDAENHLPKRAELASTGADGKPGKLSLDFDDWRAAGTSKMPYSLALAVDNQQWTLVCEKWAANPEIPANRFDVPDAVQRTAARTKPEAHVERDGFMVQIMDRPVQHIASIRATVKPAEISQALMRILPKVHMHVSKLGLRTMGAPFSRYHTVPTEVADSVDFEAGIPVDDPIKPVDDIKARELPAGKVAMTWHIGPYHELTTTYTKLQNWMKKHGHTARGGPWEFYWTDPGLEPNPKKWRTQVMWPIN